jgi:hypothetical protein
MEIDQRTIIYAVMEDILKDHGKGLLSFERRRYGDVLLCKGPNELVTINVERGFAHVAPHWPHLPRYKINLSNPDAVDDIKHICTTVIEHTFEPPTFEDAVEAGISDGVEIRERGQGMNNSNAAVSGP